MAQDLKKEYDFVNNSNSNWIKHLGIFNKTEIAILLNKYAKEITNNNCECPNCKEKADVVGSCEKCGNIFDI